MINSRTLRFLFFFVFFFCAHIIVLIINSSDLCVDNRVFVLFFSSPFSFHFITMWSIILCRQWRLICVGCERCHERRQGSIGNPAVLLELFSSAPWATYPQRCANFPQWLYAFLLPIVARSTSSARSPSERAASARKERPAVQPHPSLVPPRLNWTVKEKAQSKSDFSLLVMHRVNRNRSALCGLPPHRVSQI